MPVTLNVTLAVVLGMDDFAIEHVPALEVLEVAVPVAPLLQMPVTVTRLTTAWLSLWTLIVMVAVHELDAQDPRRGADRAGFWALVGWGRGRRTR